MSALPPSAVEDLRLPRVLLALTAATGIIDAVSFLGMGRVFTANMTGNAVILGFALGGAPGVSVLRSAAAMVAFLAGAVVGGRMAVRLKTAGSRWVAIALGVESFVLLAASGVALFGTAENSPPVFAVIALTGIAMGSRNATARALGVADLTTTVLTLTLTGLAADSSLAGGTNPRWQRRLGAVAAMIAGAAAGSWLLQHSLMLPLAAAALISAVCAVVTHSAGTSPQA